MRDPERLDEFYDELKRIHKEKFPDWRVGQFWMNVLGEMQGTGKDPFFPEEQEMIEFIRKYAGKRQ